MAIYHLNATIIGRSAGRSSVAAAAYRSGQKLVDKRTGTTHDYTRKRGIYESVILAPDCAPDWVNDREALWNTVEAVEKRHDAQLAREIDLALPIELTHQQKRSLTLDFFQRECVERGMIADVSLHDFSSKNPHAHVMLSTRTLTEAGFGNKNRDWNQKEVLQHLRASWSASVNTALEQAGHDVRVDHRTLEAQGSDLIPQIHLGPNVSQMEARGISTDRGDLSREITQANSRVKSLEAHSNTTEITIDRELKQEQQRKQREDRQRQQEENERRQREQRKAEYDAKRQQNIDRANQLIQNATRQLSQYMTKKPKKGVHARETAATRPDPIQPPEILPIHEPIDWVTTWAAEIMPIAARLFEYYAAQGLEADFNNDPTQPEWVYRVHADDRAYWLSRNDQTGEYNLRGQDRDLDLRLGRGITEQDVKIWRDWKGWLDQQAKLQAPPPVTLTLETAGRLAPQQWAELTPRQQLKLVEAARQHQRTEPQGYTHLEQWVGQRSQIEQQLRDLKQGERDSRATLRDLEERGERSLLNPLGVTWERLHEAREFLAQAQTARKSAERELKEIVDRQTERHRQDAAREEWRITPQAQAAQHILRLIQQPELKAQFEETERIYHQLQRWHDSATSARQTEEIKVVAARYLDGHGLIPQVQQKMHDQLTQTRQRDEQYEM